LRETERSWEEEQFVMLLRVPEFGGWLVGLDSVPVVS
jgi:hypothetical protein